MPTHRSTLPGMPPGVSAGPAARAMVGLGWRRLRRDPVGLIFTLVMPVAIAVVMGAIYMGEAAGPGNVGVVADVADPVAGDLLARLESNPALEVHLYPDRGAVDRAVRRRTVDAGVVMPSGLPTGLDEGAVELVGPPGIAAPSGIRAAVEAAAADTTAAVQLGAVLSPADPLGTGLDAARARLTPDGTTVVVDDAAADDRDRDRRRDSAGYAVVATLVLFVFMNTAAGASSWAESRELGVLDRLRSTSAPAGALAWGFGLWSASYAAVQGTIVLAVGVVLFDLPLRSPAAVLALLAATAVAAGGVAVLVATVLPTSASGTTIAGPLAFVLAMLGGCLWPLEIVPPALAALGQVTPHLWAVEGLRAATVHGDGLAAIGGYVAVLVAIGVVVGAAGGRRMARAAGAV